MGHKILLVEDDPCFGSVLKSYLELSDYDVIHCTNGVDGFEAFRKEKFDLCLLDVMMPEMDGFTLGKKIRELDVTVPFVYITAKSMKDDMKLGYEIGADDYIVKPFDSELLIFKIKAILSRCEHEETEVKPKLIELGAYLFNTELRTITKGDEVIKLVAEKVRQNMREGDIAGRYGGDEIAIIMPNTSIAQAKYVAEYLTYSLSCCFIDDIGPVKVSVGIATYPDCSEDKEKLLILAEQAMYISQAKGYKDGMSAIISSADFNFWDDVALKSYAEVIGKRHAQLGINFEDELISKFNADHAISGARISEIATSLAGAIDAKDPYTKGHSTSVSRFSEALARAINLPEDEVERIKLGALLHDVGKIGIPETVLKKEGPLSDDEWAIMKQHPTIGAEKVLMPNPSLRDLIPIVKYHHERIDGKGYPEGLANGDIPLAAKIVAIADTYHALISDRPYRRGMNIEKAISILNEGAGTQWDGDLVRTFIQIAPSLGV